MSLLGLDVGTTGCKAIAFDLDGNILSQAYREYPLLHPRPDWSELDPELIWASCRQVLAQAAQATPSDPVKALSVSVQGEAVVPLDSHGHPLYNFSVSFDHRTIPQFEWWQEHLGRDRIFQITGMPLHPMHSINKIIWFRENMPEVFRAATKFLCVEDFINFRLGAAPAMDYSLAARTMAFDVVNKLWSSEMLKQADLDESLLATVYPSGTAVGEVSTKVRDEIGFSHPVVIATGGHDQPCGALGAGCVHPGQAMNATGTSDVLCATLDSPQLTPKMLEGNYACYPHVVEPLYVALAFNLTGGLLLRWYRDTLCWKEVQQAAAIGKDPYELIIANASKRPADAQILPHFVGSGTPTLDPRSRGVITGLTLGLSKADLSRAVLDSTNYEMKLNLDTMLAAGITIRELRAIGGGAKSPFWLQLKADTTGLPVLSLKVSEAAALGAAILAGCAIGLFAHPAEAPRAMVHPVHRYDPDSSNHEILQQKFLTFIQTYPRLKGLLHSLADRPGH